jgi:hypothetical protein
LPFSQKKVFLGAAKKIFQPQAARTTSLQPGSTTMRFPPAHAVRGGGKSLRVLPCLPAQAAGALHRDTSSLVLCACAGAGKPHFTF